MTYQLKILTTALFSVLLLHRTINRTKWISLLILTLGVATVQLPSRSVNFSEISRNLLGSNNRIGNSSPISSKEFNSVAEQDVLTVYIGFIAVTMACFISGLAGVYFEKVLKTTTVSLWLRNVQLSFYSLFPAFIVGVLLNDGKRIAQYGFFNGYNAIVWSVILFQALGGLVVAITVAFADNIMKNFATSISILISFLFSVVFFGFEIQLKVSKLIKIRTLISSLL